MLAILRVWSVWRLAAIACLASCGLVALAAPSRFHAVALSAGNSQAYGLNRLGDVSLYADDLGGYTGAWVEGALVPVPLGSGSRPSGYGQVGVLVDNGDGRQRPGLFNLRSGAITEVGPPHSLPPLVQDANTRGIAVGCVAEAPPNAKVYLGDAEVDLGQGCVNAVNRAGAVAGTLWVYDPVRDASAWRGFASAPGLATMQLINPFPGGASTEARDISGPWVVGSSDLDGGTGSQAFVHHMHSGRTLPLPGLGGAWSGALGVISPQDWIVGWASLPGDADFHAVLWTHRQGAYDLNALSDVPAGWTLYEAVDVNPRGQIVANALDAGGNVRAFLLTPVPKARTLSAVNRPMVSRQLLCGLAVPWGQRSTTRRPAACRGIGVGN